MSAVYVEAVGIAAPGLGNWTSAAAILRGEAPYAFAPLTVQPSALLSANERRRAAAIVRLAFQAAEDAVAATSLSPRNLATVFASSDADLHIIDRISTALTTEQRFVSPIDFHNSVHNAAAGYWSIAVGACTPSTTVSGYDDSFAIGLSEALGLVAVDGADVLLVAFDLPPPSPLYAKRPIEHPASVALVLTPERTARSLAKMRSEASSERATTMSDETLETLRCSTPAARALPLLERLARRESGRVVLAGGSGVGHALAVEPL
jgi:hypothetical protein